MDHGARECVERLEALTQKVEALSMKVEAYADEAEAMERRFQADLRRRTTWKSVLLTIGGAGAFVVMLAVGITRGGVSDAREASTEAKQAVQRAEDSFEKNTVRIEEKVDGIYNFLLTRKKQPVFEQAATESP